MVENAIIITRWYCFGLFPKVNVFDQMGIKRTLAKYGAMPNILSKIKDKFFQKADLFLVILTTFEFSAKK